jgi:N-acetylneuraminic acid mutarotase
VGVIGGKLYAVGGYNGSVALGTLEVYDPGTNSWVTKSPMPTPRAGLAVGVLNDTLYAIGGWDPPGFRWFHVVEMYDPSTDSWSTAALAVSSFWGATAVLNGVLYADLGGFPLVAYDPSANTLTPTRSRGFDQIGSGVAAINGIVYVVGGFIGSGQQAANDLQAYDPALDRWQGRAFMPTPRIYLAAAAANGLIYAVGGNGCCAINGTATSLPLVEAYDPVSNAWMTWAPMPTGRENFALPEVSGVLYAVGGFSQTRGYLASVEALQP